MYAKMYEKWVVQVLGLAKDWYFMKRNLNYNGKTYDLSPEERSKLFEIYARAKGKN